MPANLTIKYLKAEKAYRRASTPVEELECLQIMFRELPKHKGTDKMQADLKQKISRIKLVAAQSQKTANKRGYRLPRQGAGRAVIIGGPNAGKSQLLASLSNAKPDIAEFPFSTREPQPGMMPWEDACVQLVDTPPITADVFDSITLELIRGAQLVLLMLNLGDDDGGQQLQDVWNQVQQSRSRLSRHTSIDRDDIGVTYTRAFLVINKIDLADAADRFDFFSDDINCDLETFRISALKQTGLESLRDAIYRTMDVVRVYTRSPNEKQADLDTPFLLPKGQTVMDLAELIHKDVARNFKSARVWGSDVHDGTVVTGDYMLADKDVVELNS